MADRGILTSLLRMVLPQRQRSRMLLVAVFVALSIEITLSADGLGVNDDDTLSVPLGSLIGFNGSDPLAQRSTPGLVGDGHDRDYSGTGRSDAHPTTEPQPDAYAVTSCGPFVGKFGFAATSMNFRIAFQQHQL
eukprot:scaffold276801_cov37-Prasinocladus_malaysianus.AAC.1